MNKVELHHHLVSFLQDKLDAIERELAATLNARNSETKSSAGDKHEVGRAMIQQDLDQLEGQRSKLIGLQQELARVSLDRNYDRIGFGSLVITDQGNYFVAIGLGAVTVQGRPCYAISLASPIGQALRDKQVGDKVPFNGKLLTVLAIQ